MTNIDVTEQGNSWTSVLLIGGLFGIIAAILGLISGYIQISQEPTGSFFGPAAFTGILICLITAFAGMVTVWHYTKEVTREVSYGQGAVMGLLTAVAITLISVVLTQIWYLIDPNYLQNYIESMIANFEAMGLPDEALDAQTDQLMQAQTMAGVLKQSAISMVVLSILNMITASLGVRIFGEKKDEL
jgi:hypothetical protein